MNFWVFCNPCHTTTIDFYQLIDGELTHVIACPKCGIFETEKVEGFKNAQG